MKSSLGRKNRHCPSTNRKESLKTQTMIPWQNSRNLIRLNHLGKWARNNTYSTDNLRPLMNPSRSLIGSWSQSLSPFSTVHGRVENKTIFNIQYCWRSLHNLKGPIITVHLHSTISLGLCGAAAQSRYQKPRVSNPMLLAPNKAESADHGCLIPARVIWLCTCVRWLATPRGSFKLCPCFQPSLTWHV